MAFWIPDLVLIGQLLLVISYSPRFDSPVWKHYLNIKFSPRMFNYVRSHSCSLFDRELHISHRFPPYWHSLVYIISVKNLKPWASFLHVFRIVSTPTLKGFTSVQVSPLTILEINTVFINKLISPHIYSRRHICNHQDSL